MFFSKKEPEEIYIKGKQLECPVCHNKLFDKKKSVVMGFLLQAGINANTYICSECSYIYWFKHNPDTQQ